MKKLCRSLFISILLVGFVLTGCTSGGGNKNTQETTKPIDTNSNSNSNAENNTAPAKYDPPIEITTVGVNYPTVKYSNGDTRENNDWTRAYLDNFGINLKYKWVVDDSQYEQKNNLMMSTGDIPDFMNVSDIHFKQLIESDLIENLTDIYNKYATDSVKKMMTEGGEKALQSATVNGKLMGLPFTSNNKEVAHVLWVRTDWLKKLNLPEPKTMQDVLKISEAFTNMDPDGNGKKDTFGLALDKNFTMLEGFVNSFHAYTNIWIKDSSGQLVYGDVQPEMRTALQKLQEMSKSGQIDPEFGVKDFTKVSESLAAGKIGILYNPSHAGSYPLQSVRDNDPKADWQAYPILSIDNDPAKVQAQSKPIGYWVVKKGYKHPEAIIKMLDFWIKTFYENKDLAVKEKYVATVDGNTPWLLNAIAAYRSFFNVEIQNDIAEVVKGNKKAEDLNPVAFDTYTKVMNFTEKHDEKFWGFDKVYGLNGARGVTSTYYIKGNLFMENEFYTSATPTMASKMATLQKMKDETFTKIITGNAPIEEFDKFVENWKKGGGDEITKEVNDWYKTTIK